MVSPYCKKCRGHVGSRRCVCKDGPVIYRWSDGVWRAVAEPLPLGCVLALTAVLACICVIVIWF